MDVLYERMMQLFLIAHSDSPVVKSFSVREGMLTIRYSEYVKSQIHLNTVSGFYSSHKERNIFEYAKALEYLEGNTSSLDAARMVLSYYYEDMSRFMLRNKEEIALEVLVDSDLDIPTEEVSFSGVKGSILDIISCAVSGNPAIRDAISDKSIAMLELSGQRTEELFEKLEHFPYADVFDQYNLNERTINDFCSRINNVTYSSILGGFASHDAKNIRKMVII